ncbi:hypothetical protein Rhe02_31890 [Rhizocola hellebori]|uniref:ADP-ribosylglycohydrolase family protein n=1 Tax=Rhizocola hellebori TaxID=1392758 RepID=A0A8J3Q8E8_9ACTN|nr:hypothetical protein Rhe02_31890 [Rhizocola hellebori]
MPQTPSPSLANLSFVESGEQIIGRTAPPPIVDLAAHRRAAVTNPVDALRQAEALMRNPLVAIRLAWHHRWVFAVPAAALDSLRGLALGDAFGDTWFLRPAGEVEQLIAQQAVAEGPWPWTDDTAMAISLFHLLSTRGRVVQEELAMLLADAYDADPYRKYGPSMHGVLEAIHDGEPWREVTTRQFGGQGSWGNGAAMRVAPLGAWFATDLDLVAEQARLSARAPDAHPGKRGGVAATPYRHPAV